MRIQACSAALMLAIAPVASAESMPGEALLLLDVDKDGVVTFDEYSGQMNTLFGGMDTNQNGRLERSEVDSFMSGDVFSGADANRNGNLSKSEFDAQVRKDFESADQDGDGTLD